MELQWKPREQNRTKTNRGSALKCYVRDWHTSSQEEHKEATKSDFYVQKTARLISTPGRTVRRSMCNRVRIVGRPMQRTSDRLPIYMYIGPLRLVGGASEKLSTTPRASLQPTTVTGNGKYRREKSVYEMKKKTQDKSIPPWLDDGLGRRAKLSEGVSER